MSAWVVVLWLLVPGVGAEKAHHVPVMTATPTRAQCERDLMQHLQAEGRTIVAASRCVEVTPWLHLVRP